MKLGFLTVCLRGIKLENLVRWGKKYGFQMLEVPCPPIKNTGEYPGGIDVANLKAEEADRIKEVFRTNSMEISSLAYYDNNLDPDLEKRKNRLAHLKKVIDVARLLGVNLVGTFIGRCYYKTVKENFSEVRKVFPDIVKYASDRGVRIMIENCPMENIPYEGVVGNIAYNPETWHQLFEIVPDIGLNFDPSHFYWQKIDYLSCIREFKDKIFHVHAKDTEIIYKNLAREGIFGHHWWRYRLPGLGGINWSKFISVLGENGYDGVLSIEHEDPLWGGSDEKVKKGLILGQRHLSQFLI